MNLLNFDVSGFVLLSQTKTDNGMMHMTWPTSTSRRTVSTIDVTRNRASWKAPDVHAIWACGQRKTRHSSVHFTIFCAHLRRRRSGRLRQTVWCDTGEVFCFRFLVRPSSGCYARPCWQPRMKGWSGSRTRSSQPWCRIDQLGSVGNALSSTSSFCAGIYCCLLLWVFGCSCIGTFGSGVWHACLGRSQGRCWKIITIIRITCL